MKVRVADRHKLRDKKNRDTSFSLFNRPINWKHPFSENKNPTIRDEFQTFKLLSYLHIKYWIQTYLKVGDDFTKCVAHEPGFRDVPDDGGREAEEDDKKIGDGKVHDEHVGHSTHRVIPVDSQTD